MVKPCNGLCFLEHYQNFILGTVIIAMIGKSFYPVVSKEVLVVYVSVEMNY